MKRYVCIAHGDVQRVGYHDKVQKIALKSKITGQVKNLDDLTVEITFEGQDENLSLFLDAVRITEYPVFIEHIDVKEEPYLGEYSGFKVIRGTPDEEMGERFDTAIQYLARIDKNSDSIAYYSEISANNSTKLIGMIDESLHKQDLMLKKQDVMIEKQDDTVQEIKHLRHDINDTLDKRFNKIESELEYIKDILHQKGIMT